MKKYITLFVVLLVALSAKAQQPAVGFSYQAVALDKSKSEQFGRDSQGEVLSSTNLMVRFTITEQTPDGAEVYKEKHTTRTDMFGMFRLVVGRGVRLSGDNIGTLAWGQIIHFLHVEIDKGQGFEYLGNEELLGAPYAMNSNPQSLNLVGNTLSISGGNAVILSDMSETNELQQLSKSGNQITLSNGGGSVTDEVNDADASPTNELVTGFAVNGANLELTDAGGTRQVPMTDLQAGINTDNQDLSLTTNTLSLTNDATTVDLSGYLDNTDEQDLGLTATEITISNGAAINLSALQTAIDRDEQDLTLTTNTLSLTNDATTVDLSGYLDNTDEQDLGLTATELTITNGSAINLSALQTAIDTDEQDLTLTTNTLSLTNDATTVDLSGYLDNTDEQDLGLTATELTITNGAAINLSALQTAIDTDEQDLTLTTNTLSLTNDATTVDLSGYLDAAFATTGGVTSNSPGTIATDNFVFGSPQLADDGSSDHDARMFFDKSKGAFRAGYVFSTQWDDVNVGQYSFASGLQTIASGDRSTSMGGAANASGFASVAMGNGPQASGEASVAMGNGTQASGYNSTALGLGNSASGTGSIAVGALTTAHSYGEMSMGSYNTPYTPSGTTSFNAADRVLVVGNGFRTLAGVTTRSDALLLYKSGNMTLHGQLTLDADNVGGSGGYTLPAQRGTNGQVMTTDGSGVVSWAAVQSGAFSTTGGVTSNSSGTFASDDFVFGSDRLDDDNSTTDDDARMFFDKSKGAFRAGWVPGNRWDNSNVGNYSVALGGNNIASGAYSTAMGNISTASGSGALAIGWGARASGSTSTAFGSGTASGSSSTAFGWFTTASSWQSTAMGANTSASAWASTAMGNQTTAHSFAEVSMGSYNTSYTPGSIVNFTASDRLLVVGNGFEDAFGVPTRSDAFIIYKNGNATLSGNLTELSDERLKTAIQPVFNSVTKLQSIQGVHYKWNDVKPHDMVSVQTGFLAQDIEELFPELVKEDSEGYKSVNYTGLIPHLVEAVKELKQENETLKQLQLDVLKRLEALEVSANRSN